MNDDRSRAQQEASSGRFLLSEPDACRCHHRQERRAEDACNLQHPTERGGCLQPWRPTNQQRLWRHLSWWMHCEHGESTNQPLVWPMVISLADDVKTTSHAVWRVDDTSAGKREQPTSRPLHSAITEPSPHNAGALLDRALEHAAS